ncbi:MAG: hypothetical protein ACJA1D_000190 [Polaribacter sp.]|jgi:hypothetical protein
MLTGIASGLVSNGDIGEFNFQSGWSNLNNIADSIGSIIGMGPENRDSVTVRVLAQIKAFTVSAYNKVPQLGFDAVIKLFNDKLAFEKNAYNTMKSANSKFMAQTWIDQIPKIISDLNNKRVQAESPDFLTTTGNNIKGLTSSNSASMGYFAVGLMALYFFSMKKKRKFKSLY